MAYNKSDLKQTPILRMRSARVLDGVEWNYTRKSVIYCGDSFYTLQGKIAFYKGEFVEITSAKQLSKHTAEQYQGSIVEYKTLQADEITTSFVIRYRKQNGKKYRSKVLTAEQVLKWVSKKPYSYTLYNL